MIESEIGATNPYLIPFKQSVQTAIVGLIDLTVGQITRVFLSRTFVLLEGRRISFI